MFALVRTAFTLSDLFSMSRHRQKTISILKRVLDCEGSAQNRRIANLVMKKVRFQTVRSHSHEVNVTFKMLQETSLGVNERGVTAILSIINRTE